MDYSNITPIELQKIIKAFTNIEAYSGEVYVSCENAKPLPAECYIWDNPELLCSEFDSTDKTLVKNVMVNLDIVPNKNKIEFITKDFVENLNNYLDELNDEKVLYFITPEMCLSIH